MQDKLKGSFDSETMAMLARVLDEALNASMGFRHAPLNDAELQNLSTRLGRTIVSTYNTGETDPKTLKILAVRSILKE
jgi:hypothetical protein